MGKLKPLNRVWKRPLNALGKAVTKNLVTNPLEREGNRYVSPIRLIEDGLIQASFPIDIVYTWVDSRDPKFQMDLEKYRIGPENMNTTSAARFASHDELKYSIRSIEKYAPWYNHIYIVTNGQVPSWIRSHRKLSIVTHDQILDSAFLPTFNSHVIESALHHIPGLSEHYIYFNDDVLLLRPVARNIAFSDGGLSYAFIGNQRVGNGRPMDWDTATEWGAKNARDLLLREWGYVFDRRFTHMFHAQRRSVAIECEKIFAKSYQNFRNNRFREKNDVLCCSFLHHYWGYVTGRTMLANNRGHYVRIRSVDARDKFKEILNFRENEQGRCAICLNDCIPKEGVAPDYKERLREFLEVYFPTPSSFELTGPANQNLMAAE